MPAELFRTVAVRRSSVGRRLGAVPLSIVVHAAVLAVVIVVPLVAYTDTLPFVSIPIVLQMPSAPVIPTPPPVAPPVRRVQTPMQPVGRMTPLQAPPTIAPPTGLALQEPISDVVPGDLVVGPVITSAREVEPPPPPAPPRVTRPMRPGGDVKPPVRIHYQPPVYPQTAIIAHVEGAVVIDAIISATGTVQDARVVTSVPLLDAAALAAVRQWIYTPTRLNGVPVPVIMTVTVTFKLQ